VLTLVLAGGALLVLGGGLSRIGRTSRRRH